MSNRIQSTDSVSRKKKWPKVLLIILIILLIPLIAGFVILYGRIATSEQAMDVLESVSQSGKEYPTQWSAVYNLNQYSVDITIDRDYDKVYHFTPEDFKQLTLEKPTGLDFFQSGRLNFCCFSLFNG